MSPTPLWELYDIPVVPVMESVGDEKYPSAVLGGSGRPCGEQLLSVSVEESEPPFAPGPSDPFVLVSVRPENRTDRRSADPDRRARSAVAERERRGGRTGTGSDASGGGLRVESGRGSTL